MTAKTESTSQGLMEDLFMVQLTAANFLFENNQ